MVTEGFRLCSPGPEVELVGVLPLTKGAVPTVGIAGGIAILPFIGEVTSGLPCWETPTAAAEDVTPEADEGAEVFLVALA